tara:strand:- start:1456 stop:1782 length:327 start_codon:yes stop_codon:yes gene_type:complete
VALVTLSDLGGFKPLNIRGVLVQRDVQSEIPVIQALLRCSDTKLMFTFEEKDRKDLESIDPELFPTISSELRKKITTHKELIELLLPKKSAAKKKTAPKAKKSSLTEE